MENVKEKTEKYTTYTYDYRAYASEPVDLCSAVNVFESDKVETKKSCWLDDFGWI